MEKDSYVRQCMKCLNKWNQGTHLTKKGEEKKHCPKCNSTYVLDTKLNPTHIIIKEELLMWTDGQYPNKYCPTTTYEEMYGSKVRDIVDTNGVKIFISRGMFEDLTNGHSVWLYIDRKVWMTTDPDEKESMELAVEKCPRNSRVFIAGLGLGLTLLSLAKSGKATEVIVCEREKRIIDVVEPVVRRWMDKHYPSFNWRVIQGDAVAEINRNGKFDWIFFDIWSIGEGNVEGEPSPQTVQAIAERNLLANGVATMWTTVIAEMKAKKTTPEYTKRLQEIKNLFASKDLI